MTFYVGQKVVCINDSFTDLDWSRFITLSIITPKRGLVYTIRRIFSSVKWSNGRSSSALHLEELVNPEIFFLVPSEIPFSVRRFRPLIERKSETNIQFALDILDKANRRISEPV